MQHRFVEGKTELITDPAYAGRVFVQGFWVDDVKELATSVNIKVTKAMG